MRVLIADDHRLMIEGVRAALEGAEDIEIVGTAFNGAEVMPLVHRLQPDLVLLDLAMPLMDGLTCLQRLQEHYPEVKVVILSAFTDPERIEAAFSEGASGYIVKGADSSDLATTLRRALQGTSHMTVGLPQPSETTNTNAAGLTKREVPILELIAQGHSNRQVADSLSVTEQTVKFHLTNIYRKLGVTNRTGAARAAYTLGLVQSPAVDSLTAA
jgi:DNA-binding NarL/FixJ family response regulator